MATDKKNGFFAFFIKLILLFLSFAYGIIIRLLIFISFLDLKRFNLRIISVGNITVGGTGKTSLVEYIARKFRERGSKVAILTRGYKRGAFDLLGDEPKMLLKNLSNVPVVVNKNRAVALRRIEKEYGIDIVVLDDGMQQWRIKKDLEIVTIDATNPFGNKHMIPRGILRQPLSTLKKADIFVLTKTDLAGNSDTLKRRLDHYNSKALIVESVHYPVGFYRPEEEENLIPKDFLKEENVAILSGIGDPDSFASTVSSLGIKIALDLRFGDHHNYTSGEIKAVTESIRNKGLNLLIITEKDATRLSDKELDMFAGIEVFVLRIELKILKNEENFLSRLFRVYSF